MAFTISPNLGSHGLTGGAKMPKSPIFRPAAGGAKTRYSVCRGGWEHPIEVEPVAGRRGRHVGARERKDENPPFWGTYHSVMSSPR